ncbi:MAG: glycosyltransferase [Betaproteobacteria bacterium]|nr:glycosyltransferase [Betaproteobacteria bacterium]
MRILHTEWSDGWGGQEHRIISEIVGMRARGHDAWLATRPQCAIAREAARRDIPVALFGMRHRADLGTLVRLARFLRRERIEIVNTHSSLDSWLGAFAARLARVPVLVRTRHLNLPLKRGPVHFAHYLPDAVITCGDAMKKRLVEENGFPEPRVASIPTGIDFGAFRPMRPREAVRRDLGLAPSDFVILMAAVLRSVKRHALALEAFAELLPSRPNARLVLAGNGPLRRETEQRAAALGIAQCVHFLGHRDDVADLMQAADVCLLTSRSEGVPQALTQAMGLGVPVVATAVGGVPELVAHERTGLLVPPESAKAIAAALERVAENPAWSKRLAAQGQARVLSDFSLETMLAKTDALFRALLAAKTRSAS